MKFEFIGDGAFSKTSLLMIVTRSAAYSVIGLFILACYVKVFKERAVVSYHVMDVDVLVFVFLGATIFELYMCGYYQKPAKRLGVRELALFLFSLVLLMAVYTGILLVLI